MLVRLARVTVVFGVALAAPAAYAAGGCDVSGPCADPSLTTSSPLARVPITITAGSPGCGGATFSPAASPPFTGELDDGTGAKLADLGSGCLYFGNGSNVLIPGGSIPEGAKLVLNVVRVNGLSLVLGPSAGTGPHDCTLGASATRHCVNGATGTDGAGACATNADCGGTPGACAQDARCFFGPPLPVPVPSLPFASTCVVNAFSTGACGALDLLTQEVTFASGISARAYQTGNADTPCPRCVAGHCDAGKNVNGACTPVGQAGTSIDCPPDDSTFAAALVVDIFNGSTSTRELSKADGKLCPLQTKTGAFGEPATRTIVTHGSPLNPLGLLTHRATMTVAAPFCIPPTGNFLIDAVGGLPGPGAFSVSSTMDLSDLLRLGLPIP